MDGIPPIIPPMESLEDFERATEAELKQAQAEAKKRETERLLADTPRLELFDVGDEDGNISPREWLLGTTYCRGNLSGLISAGAGGKTTVRILQALSLASGRELSGEHVFVRGRVMIICLEDNMKELRRRVRAAMLHHKVTPARLTASLS
jgi:RecA-family ATPase